jgi:hypothetical protein
MALALLVGILSFSATGVVSLMLGEPCTAFSLSAEDDRDCPPTCVSCGCCTQAVETAAIVVASSPDTPVTQFAPVLPSFTDTQPRDILHVPKLRLA